jgi:hypothetical protein
MSQHKTFAELVAFAAVNHGKGVLIEPRFYYDFLDFSTFDTDVSTPPVYNGDGATFSNAEKFPVRLTHVIASPMYAPLTVGVVDPVAVLRYTYNEAAQGVDLRLERYQEFYMNENRIRLPGWCNTYTAPPLSVGNSVASCRFHQPLVLSSRDTLHVTVEQILGAQPVMIGLVESEPITVSGGTGVTVTATGVGLRSGRPYQFGAFQTFPTNGPLTQLLDPSQFQNIGGEPVAIVEMALQVGPGNTVGASVADAATSAALYDTRLYRLQVKQVGNGTGNNWMRGPSLPTPVVRMPSSLFGTQTGNAIVHTFPGDGLTLEPGETLRAQGSRYASTLTDTSLLTPTQIAIGIHGYLMVR